MRTLTTNLILFQFIVSLINNKIFANGINTTKNENIQNRTFGVKNVNVNLTRDFNNISRCCNLEEELIKLNSEKYTCQSVHESAKNFSSIDETEVRDFRRGFPNCSYKILTNSKDKIFKTFSDGSVKVGLQVLLDFAHPVWLSVDEDGYCVDSFRKTDNEDSLNEFDILFYCAIKDWDDFGSISLFTMTPYLLLWDTQNVSGWTQCSFFLALGLDCLFIGLYNFLYQNPLSLVSTYFCNLSGNFLRIVEMGCYCTWAIGCYDMLRIVWFCNRRMESNLEFLRFNIYMFVGWGIPILTVLIEEIFHVYYNKNVDAYMRCPSPITESLPVAIIQIIFIFATTIMFITTVIVIRKHSKDAQLAAKSINTRYGKPVLLFLKLTLLMGCPFVVITVLEITLGENMGNSWILILLRSMLLITVLMAFKMFGCTKRNLKKIKQKYF